MASKKILDLAEKINTTPGARDVVLPMLEVSEIDNSAVILSIDEMSKSHAQSLEKLSEEIKKLSEMLTDGVNNHAEYYNITQEMKRLQKTRLVIKQKLMLIPQNAQMNQKLKDLRMERKEKQEALSDYLIELERMTGANQLELFDGTIYEIRKTARLVKKGRGV